MWSTASGAASASERTSPNATVHNGPGKNVKASGDDQTAGENAIMAQLAFDLVPPRPPDGKRQHHQGEDRQQMDGTPRSPHSRIS
jgi:hypothetical protein